MPNGVNVDLGFGRLIEYDIGVKRHGKPADSWIVRANADVRMKQKKIDKNLDTRLNTPRPLWGTGLDVFKDRVEFDKRRKGAAKPHKPYLLHTARTW